MEGLLSVYTYIHIIIRNCSQNKNSEALCNWEHVMTSLTKETGISMIHVYKEKARGRQNRDQMTKKSQIKSGFMEAIKNM